MLDNFSLFAYSDRPSPRVVPAGEIRSIANVRSAPALARRRRRRDGGDSGRLWFPVLSLSLSLPCDCDCHCPALLFPSLFFPSLHDPRSGPVHVTVLSELPETLHRAGMVMDMADFVVRRIDVTFLEEHGPYWGVVARVEVQSLWNKHTKTDERDPTPVIVFEDGLQLPLNKQARLALMASWGRDTDRYVGRRLGVYLKLVEFPNAKKRKQQLQRFLDFSDDERATEFDTRVLESGGDA
jgi:hypothetical protein